MFGQQWLMGYVSLCTTNKRKKVNIDTPVRQVRRSTRHIYNNILVSMKSKSYTLKFIFLCDERRSCVIICIGMRLIALSILTVRFSLIDIIYHFELTVDYSNE